MENSATIYKFFLSGNYQDTLNDANAAIELEPGFIKGIERGRIRISAWGPPLDAQHALTSNV